MKKAIQCKSIDDIALVRHVQRLSDQAKADGSSPTQGWVNTWDLEALYPDVPHKVFIAKLQRLVERKLLDGCTCGCRGDFTVISRGKALLLDAQIRDIKVAPGQVLVLLDTSGYDSGIAGRVVAVPIPKGMKVT